MSDDLYFLPILARAVRAPNPREALMKAFETIEDLSRRPEHRDGYRQFLEYIREISRHSAEGDSDEAAGLEDLAEGSREDLVFDFVIERDGAVVGTLPFPAPGGTRSIRGIIPGHYVVSVHGSRVIWEDDISRKDVLWTAAYPGLDLPAAAETDTRRNKPTRVVTLLDGEVTLRLYPGIRSGILDLVVSGGEGGSP